MITSNTQSSPLLPGSVIGILGSGQLGRMLALEARRMGYYVHVYSPDRHSPTGQVADKVYTADYLDLTAVAEFARGVDVITYEFENVPQATAEAAATITPVHPGPHVLHTAQNRQREKQFLADHQLPVPRFQPVNSLAELQQLLLTFPLPAVLKTAEFGYDGKGQAKINRPEEATAVWQQLGGQPTMPTILEAWIPFERELSVVGARDDQGRFAHYGVIENHHVNHILDLSLSPAPIPPHVAQQAVSLTETVLMALDVQGVLCVEFFLTTNEQLLINEMAPRPHNSGHLTLDSHVTSQFEQQLRAICGLPLGSTRQRQPAAMANLLGDLWPGDGQPDWATICALPEVKLHLYGKEAARPGRKMGHLTALGDTVAAARTAVLAARERLRISGHTP